MFKTPMRHVGRQLDLSDDDDGGRNYEPREKSPRGSIRIGCHGAQDSIGCVGMQEDGDANVIYNNSVAVQNVASVDNGIADRLTVYAQTVADMVRCMYETDDAVDGEVRFGVTVPEVPKRRYVTSASFCNDPWGQGYLPQPPPIPLMSKFYSWLSGDNGFYLNGFWFVDPHPRMLKVNAVCVQQQFLGVKALDHEVATLVLRRFYQMDAATAPVNKFMMWREVLEPDFTFFALVMLDQGCSAYMWDMLRKDIHVLDLMCAQVAGGHQRRMMHEEAVSQMHNALFSCLTEFFAKWHCTSDRWKRRFPRITEDIFTREESSLCAIHAIRQYDGVKLKWPLNKGEVQSFAHMIMVFKTTHNLPGTRVCESSLDDLLVHDVGVVTMVALEGQNFIGHLLPKVSLMAGQSCRVLQLKDPLVAISCTGLYPSSL
ncbi:uncharacterized protein LOC119286283 isoform X3 [Triticum dicoccoides]|uniref:uncharacterized protein LOC119286283 isoform X3 n=1 Tax=Triticum dicoccoides TaxID=85692 RepID=UPI00188F675B|nr:uncharacterized protein LOC119286283 isoform X3 [Triticum dicoccoides]